MSKTVAVVGSTGFLGANVVVAMVEAGYTPIVVARRPHRVKGVLPEFDVEARHGDLTKPDSLRTALQGCTYVHTVAAMMGTSSPARTRISARQPSAPTWIGR